MEGIKQRRLVSRNEGSAAGRKSLVLHHNLNGQRDQGNGREGTSNGCGVQKGIIDERINSAASYPKSESIRRMMKAQAQPLSNLFSRAIQNDVTTKTHSAADHMQSHCPLSKHSSYESSNRDAFSQTMDSLASPRPQNALHDMSVCSTGQSLYTPHPSYTSRKGQSSSTPHPSYSSEHIHKKLIKYTNSLHLPDGVVYKSSPMKSSLSYGNEEIAAAPHKHQKHFGNLETLEASIISTKGRESVQDMTSELSQSPMYSPHNRPELKLVRPVRKKSSQMDAASGKQPTKRLMSALNNEILNTEVKSDRQGVSHKIYTPREQSYRLNINSVGPSLPESVVSGGITKRKMSQISEYSRIETPATSNLYNVLCAQGRLSNPVEQKTERYGVSPLDTAEPPPIRKPTRSVNATLAAKRTAAMIVNEAYLPPLRLSSISQSSAVIKRQDGHRELSHKGTTSKIIELVGKEYIQSKIQNSILYPNEAHESAALNQTAQGDGKCVEGYRNNKLVEKEKKYEQARYEQQKFKQAKYEQQKYVQPKYEQPQYKQPKYEQPKYEQLKYEQLKYEQPKYEQPKYEQPKYEQTKIEQRRRKLKDEAKCSAERLMRREDNPRKLHKAKNGTNRIQNNSNPVQTEHGQETHRHSSKLKSRLGDIRTVSRRESNQLSTTPYTQQRKFSKVLIRLKNTTDENYDLRKPDENYDLRKPDETYDLRKPDETYDLRKPDENYDLRKPDENYDLRKPDENYDLIKPDETYDLRKPDENYDLIKPDENYDLRKPDEIEKTPKTSSKSDRIDENSRRSKSSQTDENTRKSIKSKEIDHCRRSRTSVEIDENLGMLKTSDRIDVRPTDSNNCDETHKKPIEQLMERVISNIRPATNSHGIDKTDRKTSNYIEQGQERRTLTEQYETDRTFVREKRLHADIKDEQLVSNYSTDTEKQYRKEMRPDKMHSGEESAINTNGVMREARSYRGPENLELSTLPINSSDVQVQSENPRIRTPEAVIPYPVLTSPDYMVQCDSLRPASSTFDSEMKYFEGCDSDSDNSHDELSDSYLNRITEGDQELSDDSWNSDPHSTVNHGKNENSDKSVELDRSHLGGSSGCLLSPRITMSNPQFAVYDYQQDSSVERLESSHLSSQIVPYNVNNLHDNNLVSEVRNQPQSQSTSLNILLSDLSSKSDNTVSHIVEEALRLRANPLMQFSLKQFPAMRPVSCIPLVPPVEFKTIDCISVACYTPQQDEDEFPLPDICTTKKRVLEVIRVCASPQIFLFPNFLVPDECEAVLAAARNRFKRGHSSSPDASPAANGNTSKAPSIALLNSECESRVVDLIQTRVAQIASVSLSRVEPLCVMRYTQNQSAEPYLDGSFRSHTVCAFLNDIDEGGELHFVNLGIKIPPNKGMAVMWPNVTYTNGEAYADMRLLHALDPPVCKTKYSLMAFVTAAPPAGEDVQRTLSSSVLLKETQQVCDDGLIVDRYYTAY